MNKYVIAVAVLASSMAVATGESSAQWRGYDNGWGWGDWGPGWGGGPRMGMPGRGRHMMIDANEDGVVSAEEAASAADEVFTAMDADDDGKLTKEEYMSVRMGPQRGYFPERHAAMQAAKSARFTEMDGDKDNMVSKAEFLDSAKRHHAAADADGDGKVSPWEHRGRNWN